MCLLIIIRWIYYYIFGLESLSFFSDFDSYLTVVAVKKLRVDGWRRTYIRISYRNQVAEGRRRERERERKKRRVAFSTLTLRLLYIRPGVCQ